MTVPKINSAHGSDTRNVINAAIDAINFQGKTIQDLVADGQLTEEQYAQLITVINGLIKSGHVDKSDLTSEFKDEIEGFSSQLAQTHHEATRKRQLEDLEEDVISAIEGGEGTSFNLLSIPQDGSVNLNKLDNFIRSNVLDLERIGGSKFSVTISEKSLNLSDWPELYSSSSVENPIVLSEPATETGLLTVYSVFARVGNPKFITMDRLEDHNRYFVKDKEFAVTVTEDMVRDGGVKIETDIVVKEGQYVAIISDNTIYGSSTDSETATYYRYRNDNGSDWFQVINRDMLFYYQIGGRTGEIDAIKNEFEGKQSGVGNLLEVRGYGDDGDAIISALQYAKIGDTVLMEGNHTYITNKTIKVPFGVTLMGKGRNTIIKLADAPHRNLTGYWWRSSGNGGYPIVVNEFVENSDSRSEIQGQSPNFVNFSIEGNTDIKSPQGELIIGLLVSNVENGTIDRVHVENIDYHPEGSVDGYGIVTRYCDNVVMYDPTGKNCGYENLGIYDGSKNVTIYNPQFGNAGRVSGQVHRGTENILLIGGQFINAEKINPTDEDTAAFTVHGHELESIHNITFIKTKFKTVGEDKNTAVRVFGTNFDTIFDDVFIDSDSRGGIEAYGDRLKFSGTTITKDTDSYGASFGGKDIDIKPKIYSEGLGINFSSSSDNATLEDFYIESKGFAIRADSPHDFFVKNGRAKNEVGPIVYQSSANLNGFFIIDDCILVSESGAALNLLGNALSRDKTIIRRSHLESGGDRTAEIRHSDMKFEDNTVVGTLRFRDNGGSLVKDNDFRKATLTFVDTTREEHNFINNIES